MKKLYNRIFLQITLTLCTLNFIACQEFNIDSQPEKPLNIQIDALNSYTVLATSPNNVVFNISSNTPWTITSDQQWCKPSPSMSATSSLVSEIVISFEANPDEKSRTAKLTIQAEGIESTKEIVITQASKENLIVIPYDKLVATTGETVTFSIISNKPWKIIPSTQFIENIDKLEGAGKENGQKEIISVTIPQNPGAKREGIITVKTDFEEYAFTIHQDGVILEQEEPSESGTIDFAWDELEKTIKIRANKDWKASITKEYADWIEVEKLDDSELKIKLKPSNRLAIRKGSILLSTKDIIPGFEGTLLDITQAPQFTFGEGSYMIDKETGNIKISKGNIVSNYPIKKGHLTIEFTEMNLTGTSNLLFNMYPKKGETNFWFQLQSHKACTFQCGGGFSWQAVKPTFTTDEVNAIRKIEFYVENDPKDIGKLQLRLLVNDIEKVLFNNKANVYEIDPDNNPGQLIHIDYTPATANDYYIIKSITYETEE